MNYVTRDDRAVVFRRQVADLRIATANKKAVAEPCRQLIEQT